MKKASLTVLIVIVLWAAALFFNHTDSNQAASEPKQTSEPAQSGAQAADPGTAGGPRTGFAAPDFTLGALDGKTYTLKALKGKPVIVNFWASWCGPCKTEAPELEKLYKKYQGKVEVLGVNITQNDSEKDARSFAEKYHYTFPVLLDKDGSVSDKYQIQAIPTSYFIDENGVIVDQVLGLVEPKSLEQKFERLSSGSK